MGIAISELLKLDYFKDFRVLAGRRGLNREIQGVTVLDAPDAFRWMRGKEMIVSNGYSLARDPDCIRQTQQEGFLTQMACMVVKAGRYLSPVPADMLQIFEENDIPFLEAPFSVAYMDLMHQVTIAIMNKTTKRFCISAGDTYSLGDDTYKERKLRRILQAVEVEMGFPAFLFDCAEGREFVSSVNFPHLAESRHLSGGDFWEPTFPHTRHTLCDTLHMVRYRMQEEAPAEQPRFSWITVPISFGGSIQAYFVVLESRELIDYYDEYAIRIATLLLQAVYEQLIVARRVGNIGFENLLHLAMQCGEDAPPQLLAQASALNINLNQTYFYLLLQQTAGETPLSDSRAVVSDELRLHCGPNSQFAFLQPDACLLLVPAKGGREQGGAAMGQLAEEVCGQLERRLSGVSLQCGFFAQPGTLPEAGRTVERCRQALRLGQLLYPTQRCWSYETFGPLAWLRLGEGELDLMCREYGPLMADTSKNQELLHTLKVYLASNMNFSDTAEKLYVHINTVRKRIERVNDLLTIDWADSFARMKLELLLQLLNV